MAGLVCLTLATLLGLAIYFRFTGHDMTGLEGVWHAEADTDRRQGYDYRVHGGNGVAEGVGCGSHPPVVSSRNCGGRAFHVAM